MATSGTMPSVRCACLFLLHQREKKKVQFTMAIGNAELMHEYFS